MATLLVQFPSSLISFARFILLFTPILLVGLECRNLVSTQDFAPSFLAFGYSQCHLGNSKTRLSPD